MAMNRLMHPRNPYKVPPDFKQLALEYPEFREKAIQNLSGHVRLDFRNQGSVWALTKSLLHRDFGLNVDIVPDHLVPTLPLRLNYLLWLEDLFNANPQIFEKITGIDIGCGACCIYPLLAWKHLSWRMLASEADKQNFECASQNIIKNNLTDLITVKLVSNATYLVGAVDENQVYDFCMCNPPFFKSNSSTKSRHPERHGPRNAPTGIETEVSVTGGEEAFICGIINDSALLKDKIRIYTVMLGHKSSVAPLKKKLADVGALQTATSVFCQGRTTRWGLAWTFDPRVDISSVKSPIELEKKQMKVDQPFSHSFLLENGLCYGLVVTSLMQTLDRLEIDHLQEYDDDGIYVVGISANKNTWINNRKRRREEQRRLAQIQSDLDKVADTVAANGVSTNSLSSQENVKRKLDSPLDGNPEKKVKIENDQIDVKDVYLKALITVLESDDSVTFEMSYIGGLGGKDSCNQLFVYLKSHIKPSNL